MPRAKVHPRDSEGMLVLGEFSPLSEIAAPPKEGMVNAIVQAYNEAVEFGAKWFAIETRQPVTLTAVNGGHRWAVEDNRLNSSQYKWLSTKATHYNERIVRFLKEVFGV